MTKVKLLRVMFDLPDGKVISLSAESAKELYRELDALFGEKRTERIYADKD